jgi:hypothetical protein
MKLVKVFVALCLVGMFFHVVVGQNPQGARGAAQVPPSLGLEEGTIPLKQTTRWIEITDEVR